MPSIVGGGNQGTVASQVCALYCRPCVELETNILYGNKAWDQMEVLPSGLSGPHYSVL
jgi:hypothetical protein